MKRKVRKKIVETNEDFMVFLLYQILKYNINSIIIQFIIEFLNFTYLYESYNLCIGTKFQPKQNLDYCRGNHQSASHQLFTPLH